jgi:LCP family protein required for cell wall assembly
MALVASITVLVYVDYRWGQVTKVHLPGLVHRGQDSAGPVAASPKAAASREAVHASPGPAMTILLVGNNTRTGLDPSEASQFGSSAEVGGARSDVTMLLHLDPVKGASILSIPRDLFVPMPPHSIVGSVGKIDAALNDGPENLVEAITDDLGIPIDHYVSINFDGFQHVVDALGGINMSFPTQLRDSYSGLRITQTGCTHLNGTVALAVVRARHLEYLGPSGEWEDDPESDLSRIRRDHEFLTVFAETLKAKGLTNPIQANAVLGNLVHQVTIDDGFTLGTMLNLLRHYRNLNPANVPELTLPVTLVPEGNYHYEDGSYGSVVFPTEPADQQVIDSFLDLPAPASAPGSVDIVDRSGVGAGRQVAAGLAAAGFTIADQTSEYSPASPSETVIRYHPGDLPAAQRVLSALAGAAVMFTDPLAPSGTVVLDVGSVIAVLPAPASASTSPDSAPTSLASAVPSTSPTGATGTTSAAVPTPGGEPITPSVTPLQGYDPTGC